MAKAQRGASSKLGARLKLLGSVECGTEKGVCKGIWERCQKCLIFRLHTLHIVHRGGRLLLQMLHIVLSLFVCLSVCMCVGHMYELCKMAEPVKMPFIGMTRNHVLDGVQILL